ncbi:HU family DNA-binding protein [Rhodobacter sp. NTK016B]|uniref:HU family DNA-binding protein n=1 Tax=Rhodobacter sp. NTK016B TaxID=2759676 RepID=UPI001A8EBDD3|nr:HU family DNA-binding protein [Rhodobacter sp. NTK016B]MBN8294571.1 HU family DNA-binding protein [Rhodobacter sp. NTK016B]
MTKDELIATLADDAGFTKAQAKKAIDALTAMGAKSIASGNEFNLPGLVRLSPVAKPERPGRNPRTGETIMLRAKTVVKARVAAQLTNAANAT